MRVYYYYYNYFPTCLTRDRDDVDKEPEDKFDPRGFSPYGESKFDIPPVGEGDIGVENSLDDFSGRRAR